MKIPHISRFPKDRGTPNHPNIQVIRPWLKIETQITHGDCFWYPPVPQETYVWLWINTYKYVLFRRMHIHLPSFTSYFDVNRRGTSFWPIPLLDIYWIYLLDSHKNTEGIIGTSKAGRCCESQPGFESLGRNKAKTLRPRWDQEMCWKFHGNSWGIGILQGFNRDSIGINGKIEGSWGM